jgi:hypothetical protein
VSPGELAVIGGSAVTIIGAVTAAVLNAAAARAATEESRKADQNRRVGERLGDVERRLDIEEGRRLGRAEVLAEIGRRENAK